MDCGNRGQEVGWDTLAVSCVVKVDARSTQVESPVSASQPRVIQYILNNVASAASNEWDATFAETLPGQNLRDVGQDRDAYRALHDEIERPSRDAAIVLVSSTWEGDYLIDPPALQRTLIGLAQVVQVPPDSDTRELEEVLGRQRSAFNGAVNVLSAPALAGRVRTRLFLRDEIHAWGEDRQRIAQVLAWVTGDMNLARLREHVRPEGVRLLSARVDEWKSYSQTAVDTKNSGAARGAVRSFRGSGGAGTESGGGAGTATSTSSTRRTQSLQLENEQLVGE